MSYYKRNKRKSSIENSAEEETNVGENSFSIEDGYYGTRKKQKSDDFNLSNRLSTESSCSDSSVSSDQLSPSPYKNFVGLGQRSFSQSYTDEKEIKNNRKPEDDSLYGESNTASISEKAQMMMMSMGYKEGKGLGKFGQGITAPVTASQQRGRRGLGFIIEGLEPLENMKWDSTHEHVQAQEEVVWLPVNDTGPLDFQTLSEWMKEGPKKMNIGDEIEFCHPKILKEILNSKSIFDQLAEKELIKGRSRSNPYETIGKLFFQNRAALKMANIDSMFDFMFTSPVDENGDSMIGPEELLYFADVCAAPGGFTEYVLWKRKDLTKGFCDAKGFGFTLKENDFKLHDFFASPAEFFEPHYGVSGLEGDGDVYVPDNITNFCKFVKKSTHGKGIHFMMADGGFSVEGQENIQEILSKQLYLCQFLVALGILRDGGHFVCKLFDIFTPFSVGLIYIMYKCFRVVCIHKPNSSRPANSERYIICKWKLENTQESFDYLFEVNHQLRGLASVSSKPMDVTDIVSLDVMKNDQPFYDYIYEMNNVFGERQCIALQKIRAFCQDTNLIENQQQDIRKESLQLWHLPDRPRVAPVRMDAKEKAKKLLTSQVQDYLKNNPANLGFDNLVNKIHSAYDFRFVMLASQQEGEHIRGFFLGMGGSNIYQWSGKNNKNWTKCNTKFELPPDTIVYGEIILEFRGELKAQRKVNVFHMIDGFVLNGFDISHLHLNARHTYLKKFAMALNKESRNDLAPIRCKELFKLESIDNVFVERLCRKHMKSGAMPRRVFCEAQVSRDEPARYILPSGIFLIKTTKDPYMMAFSKSQKRKYWFNVMTRQSTFEITQECIAPASDSYCNGAFWWWEDGVQVLPDDRKNEECISISDLLQHINKI